MQKLSTIINDPAAPNQKLAIRTQPLQHPSPFPTASSNNLNSSRNTLLSLLSQSFLSLLHINLANLILLQRLITIQRRPLGLILEQSHSFDILRLSVSTQAYILQLQLPKHGRKREGWKERDSHPPHQHKTDETLPPAKRPNRHSPP